MTVRPGTIVRIHLENFMTYDNFEIYPGSHLNLIIGPNGTGKSSIACGVLLCLGGKLKSLDRAHQFAAYIKSGYSQGGVEVELYEPNGRNVIIKRKIFSNNQSEFIINGQSSAVKKVMEIRTKYNIQVDNLCTFLPQEKVHDFAKLNPKDLLYQTQQTVGSGELVKLHTELKTLQSEVFDQEKNCENIKCKLEKEKQKNERLKDQVNCFREKQALSEKLLTLNVKLAQVSYQQADDHKKEVDKDTQLAEEIYKEKKRYVNKYIKELSIVEDKLTSEKQHLVETKKNEAVKQAKVKNEIKQTESEVTELENFKYILHSKLEAENEKKKELALCSEIVDKLTNDLKSLESVTGSESGLQNQLSKAEKHLKELQLEETKLMDKKNELESTEDTSKLGIQKIATKLQCLKQTSNSRLLFIQKNEPDVYKSIEWLQQNRHLFQSHIYNPILLEIDVTDPKMAKYVEARIGYKDLMSFCCTNADDLNLLIHKLRMEMQWKINAVYSDESDINSFKPNICINDIRCYGFYAYLMDFISGPNHIIRFLCKIYNIHCIPVGDDSVEENCDNVPESILCFYSENHIFRVKYSKYSGNKSITVRSLGEAKFFLKDSNQEEIQKLMDREKVLEETIRNARCGINKLEEAVNNLQPNLQRAKKELRELGTRAQNKELIEGKLNRAVRRVESIKKTMVDPSVIRAEVIEKEQLKKHNIKKVLENLMRISEDYAKASTERQKCELKCKLHQLKKSQIEEKKEEGIKELSTKESLLREMKERQRLAECKKEQLKLKAKKLANDVSTKMKSDENYKSMYDALPNTLEELEAEIEEAQTKCEFLQRGNIQVVNEYEEREEKILRLSVSLESSKKCLDEKKSKLRAKGVEWLGPVSELISRINANFKNYFEAMGCAGEVSLDDNGNKENFDEYGMKIKVKFRNEVPLQELSRHFQSGGERAVATAIFMLALQELTSVPFRFVDEINQGMDPSNERRVLQFIIQLNSQEHSCQYFFITPKILSNIECTRKMTVHCIYAGRNAIPGIEWDIKKFLGLTNSNDDEDDN